MLETRAHRGGTVVGVIGGMGPEATLEFLRRLVAATPAQDDSDHLHTVTDSNPKIPSRIAALIDGNGEDPTPVLCEMAQRLEAHGADFLVMPCNTAHHYLPAIARSVRIPLLDMVALSIEKLGASDRKPTRVGVLASPAVRLVGLFEARLAASGYTAVWPETEDEAALLGIIRAVKAGGLGPTHRNQYAAIASRMRDGNVDAFLVACTELSVMGLPAGADDLKVIDTLDALVDATIREADRIHSRYHRRER
jgi:aspartate racemase